MRDFYEEKKKSGFTWREFSKIAGFASPSYLKLVSEGKSSLSRTAGIYRHIAPVISHSYAVIYVVFVGLHH